MSDKELLTVEDRVRLLVQAISDQRDCPPVVRLYMADANASWLISESDPDDPDRLFGLCDLALGFPELGYVSLNELLALRGPLGFPVKRDDSFISDKPLSVYAMEARAAGRIVT